MICSSCGSDRMFQFVASGPEASRPSPQELPLVCRSCGRITVDGNPVQFPPTIAETILAEAEAAAAEETQAEIESDPQGARIRLYLTKLYRTAYLDGFLRALAFFRHQAKEGRLVRLRKLWRRGRAESHGSEVLVRMDLDAYTEFEQLLLLGVVPDGQDSQNVEPAVHKGAPHL